MKVLLDVGLGSRSASEKSLVSRVKKKVVLVVGVTVGMVISENVATRGFLHSTPSIVIIDHNTSTHDSRTRPLPHINLAQSRDFFTNAAYASARVRATTTTCQAGLRRSTRPQGDRYPPPGQPHPARSRRGAVGGAEHRDLAPR